MKNIRFILFLLPLLVFFVASCASTPDVGVETYYVRADGDDRNDGISEETPFRSLFKALVMASRGPARVITLLGTLDLASEQSANAERVFIIQGTGRAEITIRGRELPAGAADRAVLSGREAGRRVILVRGFSNIRFEHVEISGGRSSGEGGGIGIGSGAVVTLGPGTVVRDNRSETVGGGAALAPGAVLVIAGGTVVTNSAAGVGGGVAAVGRGSSFTLESGEIRENQAEAGGGAAIYEGCAFRFLGGAIENNRAAVAGGGLVLNRSASMRMEGGRIGGNSSRSGGGLALIEHCGFTMSGGEIRNNRADEYGGGIASDNTSSVIMEGGVLGGNSAASRGGGMFIAGPFSKSAGVIWGSNASGEDANRAESGAALFLPGGVSRETTLGEGETVGGPAAAPEGETE
ncbi:MAG: hypothetical protein LBQ44_00550 [Treponema sp.]|jgi:hypothetical protein|nr:hypothetical protein [Treponema sp.]